MCLQSQSRAGRSRVVIASLMSLGFVCAGCARPQAVLNSWLERPRDAQAKPSDPGKLLKEESRNRVAANTGASAWPGWFDAGAKPSAAAETTVADAEPAETGSVFAAFVRKREPAADRSGDPFLAAAQYQTDAESTATDPRPSRTFEGYDSTFRGLELTEHSPGTESNPRPDRPHTSPLSSGAAATGTLPDWGRHDIGRQSPYVNEFDSQYERLRTAMNDDERLTHAAPGLAIDEPRHDGQLKDEFPWSVSAADQHPFESTLRTPQAESISAPAETARTSEVEFLPPPPVIPPDAEFAASQDARPSNDSRPDSQMGPTETGHPLADAARIPRAPWLTVQDAPQQRPEQELGRTAATPWASDPMGEQFGPVGEQSGQMRIAAANEQLAMIVPHGSKPTYPKPKSRVSANAAAVLLQADVQVPPPPLPPPPAMPTRVAQEELKFTRHIAPPEPQPPDVFEQTAPSNLSRATTTTGLEWDTIEAPQPAPAPPAEQPAIKPIPRALAAIEWSDELEPAEKANKIAGLPMPMVFGISIAAAFGIGLAIRRKTNSEPA